MMSHLQSGILAQANRSAVAIPRKLTVKSLQWGASTEVQIPIRIPFAAT